MSLSQSGIVFFTLCPVVYFDICTLFLHNSCKADPEHLIVANSLPIPIINNYENEHAILKYLVSLYTDDEKDTKRKIKTHDNSRRYLRAKYKLMHKTLAQYIYPLEIVEAYNNKNDKPAADNSNSDTDSNNINNNNNNKNNNNSTEDENDISEIVSINAEASVIETDEEENDDDMHEDMAEYVHGQDDDEVVDLPTGALEDFLTNALTGAYFYLHVDILLVDLVILSNQRNFFLKSTN